MNDYQFNVNAFLFLTGQNKDILYAPANSHLSMKQQLCKLDEGHRMDNLLAHLLALHPPDTIVNNNDRNGISYSN